MTVGPTCTERGSVCDRLRGPGRSARARPAASRRPTPCAPPPLRSPAQPSPPSDSSSSPARTDVRTRGSDGTRSSTRDSAVRPSILSMTHSPGVRAAPRQGVRPQMSDQFGTPTLGTADAQMARQSFLTSVFGWMFVGLAITAGIAAYVAASSDMLELVRGEPVRLLRHVLRRSSALVIAISAGINKISLPGRRLPLRALRRGQRLHFLGRSSRPTRRPRSRPPSPPPAACSPAWPTYGYVTKRDLSEPRLDPLHGPDRRDHRQRRQHLLGELGPLLVRHLRRRPRLLRPHGLRHAEDQEDGRERHRRRRRRRRRRSSEPSPSTSTSSTSSSSC